MFKADCRKVAMRSTIFLKFFWNKEELPEDWKGSVIVPIYTEGDKTELGNYRELPNPSNTYKSLSNILLLRLTPNAEEIIRDHQCEFSLNRSITYHILCIGQIL
jgi:hypothetical protein